MLKLDSGLLYITIEAFVELDAKQPNLYGDFQNKCMAFFTAMKKAMGKITRFF